MEADTTKCVKEFWEWFNRVFYRVWHFFRHREHEPD